MAFDRFLVGPISTGLQRDLKPVNDAYKDIMCYTLSNNIGYKMRKLRKDFKDITNQKFGKLIAIKPILGNGRRLRWECKCDCGRKYIAIGSSLRKGIAVSCGSCRYLRDYERGTLTVYNSYKKHAKKRGLSFYIGERAFEELIKQNCHYCGIEPSNSIKDLIIYNGVDRVDSSQGYIKSNCVPCCRNCNLSKGALSVDDWKKYIERIYKCLIGS